jgi:hypothetical protein
MSDPLDQLRRHFAGLWLRDEGPQGQVYGGRDINGSEVMIAVLAGPLAAQPGVRNAFADVVWRHSVGSEPGRAAVYAADLDAPRPWAATRGRSGQPGAEQLLAVLPGATPTAPIPIAMIPPPPPPLPTTSPAQGYPPQPPSRSRNQWPWVFAGGGAVVAVVLVAVVAVVGVRAVWEDDTNPPGPGPTTPPVDSPDVTEPPPEPNDEPAGEPTLRDVEPVSLVGPTFEADEDTWTMAFQGWPFAFRAPKDWSCANGEPLPRIPDGDVKACFSPAVQGGVMLWECDAGCDEDEQREKVDLWLDEPDRAVRWGDSPTYYVETEENDEGLYEVELGHFFGGDSGAPRWMVGVSFDSPPENRADIQKVVNDILGQAG